MTSMVVQVQTKTLMLAANPNMETSWVRVRMEERARPPYLLI